MALQNKNKLNLETIYKKYNNKKYLHPDPLEFLYRYEDPKDQELIGLIAACLAYGNVKQILKSVSYVLQKISSPRKYLKYSSHKKIINDFREFKHRFNDGNDMARLLIGINKTLIKFGSLENCFDNCCKDNSFLIKSLSSFVNYLGGPISGLLPDPSKKSACKRLNLYLRWMIRKDNIDPGCWSKSLAPSVLIVPLDTHMHQISILLKLTARKQADIKTAIEITESFKIISPNDPVKYDFSLTRLGIREELSYSELGAAG